MARYRLAMIVLAICLTAVTGRPASAAPPDAQDDAFHVTCGESLPISVAQLLANDSDPDGDAIDILNNWVVPQPANGSMQPVAGGLQYEPDVAADNTCAATDGFSYPVTDSNGETSTAAVTITIVPVVAPNSPPMPNDDFYAMGCGNFTLDIQVADLLVNDVDPDGDPLVHELLAQPQSGTLTFDGAYHYTPTVSNGQQCAQSDSFTYRISDTPNVWVDAVATVHIQIWAPDPLPPAAPQVDENGTRCSDGAASTGSLEFDVLQADTVAGAQPVLWEVSGAAGAVASGATDPLTSSEQAAVVVTDLASGSYHVVVSGGGDPPLTDSTDIVVEPCPAVTTTTTTVTTTGSSNAATQDAPPVTTVSVALLPATR